MLAAMSCVSAGDRSVGVAKAVDCRSLSSRVLSVAVFIACPWSRILKGRHCIGAVLRRRGLRIYSSAHFRREISRGAQDRLAELPILLHELRHECVEEAEHIVADEDLAIAVRTGANSDRGNFQSRSH